MRLKDLKIGLCVCLLAVLIGCGYRHHKAHIPYPILDGKCNEYAELDGQTVNLEHQVELNIFQDQHYVWVCYSYLEGSFGTLDMYIATPGLVEPLNLHVSAQVGEWMADHPELAPQNPESELWWNNQGWIANPVWINGMDRTGEKVRYRFKNAPARELQLSKQRFGKGLWRINMEINGVLSEDGKINKIIFPKDTPQNQVALFELRVF